VKVWRYCAVSGISTVCSLGLFYLFYREVGLSPVAANITATCIATVPAYYLNRSWAWGKSGRSHFMREVVPFWAIALISLVISTIAVHYAARHTVNIHSKDVKALILLGVNLVTYGVLWVAKFAVFNKLLFKHHEPTLGGLSA
jgi:putative flippase GtrA